MAGFKDIVGNEQIIEHLQNAISMGKVSHAYIINGPTAVRQNDDSRGICQGTAV